MKKILGLIVAMALVFFAVPAMALNSVDYTRLQINQVVDQPSATRFIFQGWVGTELIVAEDIASVTWKGETIAEGFRDRLGGCFKYLKYRTGENVWYDTGYGSETSFSEIYFPLFEATPTEVGLTIVTLILKDGTIFNVEFDVTNIDEMPTVAAIDTYQVDRVNKSGKSITTGQYVTTYNLVARELDGALIIQWAEPDGAMTKPNMKLRIYVGNGWINDIEQEEFLFLDCPVQTGSVVVPADIWSVFKMRMIELEETEVDIAGMYRYQSTYNDIVNGWVTDFHNRGYIEAITFPIE